MSGGLPLTREQAEESFGHVMQGEHDDPGPMRLWATVSKADDTYIGRCGLYRPEPGGSSVETTGVLAYCIARPYWDQGFATEAARAFVRYGFDVLGLDRIVAGTSPTNKASNTILRRLGMVRNAGSGPAFDTVLVNPALGL